MNVTPRTTRRLYALLLLALVPLFACAPVVAQKNSQPRSKPADALAEKEAARARRREQETAVSLLLETAERARRMDDLYQRARILTLAADALWIADERRARETFKRAWEAATASDKAEQEEEARDSGASNDSSVASITVARDEALSKIAARDPALAGTFLDGLTKGRDGEPNSTQEQAAQTDPWHEPGPAGARRLALAYELLGLDQPKQAFQVASPVLNEGVSASLVAFIINLRDQSPADAEALYRLLLQRAAANADVNSVLMLSSPLVSPDLLVVIDARGSLQFRPVVRNSSKSGAQAPFSQAVRQSFYGLAAATLLQPRAPRESPAFKTEAVASYLAIGRLLPFFEREAGNYAAELRARFVALGEEVEAARREALASQMELSKLAPKNPSDPLRLETEQFARARNAEEREAARLSLVRTAARRLLWDRARRAAAEIENAEARRAALSFIAVSQIADISRAYREDKENDFEGVAK
ncbi:MAG TPA: hypothetical protein VF507_06355, partial [Pyrinomonadaceae bacterium]